MKRRDSILKVAQKRYSNVVVFEKETDTVDFKVTDFTNTNHLNPDGAKIFTSELNEFINNLK
jgi:hypothetical protein